MNKRLLQYQLFVDGLTRILPGVISKWVEGKGWPDTEQNARFNQLLKELLPRQREVVGQIAQMSREGGIHDTLVYLSDQINLDDLEIKREGTVIAVEPYGTEIYYDWHCRCEGDDWPEHQLDEKYKSES